MLACNNSNNNNNSNGDARKERNGRQEEGIVTGDNPLSFLRRLPEAFVFLLQHHMLTEMVNCLFYSSLIPTQKSAPNVTRATPCFSRVNSVRTRREW